MAKPSVLADQKYLGGWIPADPMTTIIVGKKWVGKESGSGTPFFAVFSATGFSASGPSDVPCELDVPIYYDYDTGRYVCVKVPVPANVGTIVVDTFQNNADNNRDYKKYVIPDLDMLLRQEYVNIIRALFGPDVPGNSEGNISPEVIALVNQALNEVQKGSKGMLAVDLGFNLFYSATAWSDLVVSIGFNMFVEPKTKTISGWVDVLNGTGSYKAVRDTVTSKYKSAVASELIR